MVEDFKDHVNIINKYFVLNWNQSWVLEDFKLLSSEGTNINFVECTACYAIINDTKAIEHAKWHEST